MLWILGSLFFLYCAWREIRRSMVAAPGYDFPQPLSKAYLGVALSVAAVLAWTPIHTWYFERLLSAKATELAEGHRAKVHCNTIFDTMMDPDMLFAGHANFETGEIGIQHPWCERLMAYLRHPQQASREELESLNILTHESMHVRGEHNEARTECQAVQRDYRTARMLGVPDEIARQNAMDYYTGPYLQRGVIGGMQGDYFSLECAPGKAMDEHLSDSTWAAK